MRLALTIGLCAVLSASPVLAGPSTNGSSVAGMPNACGWSAQMEEHEGGPGMEASSCDNDTEIGPVLRLLCGGGINIRYNEPDLIMDAPARGTIVLTSGGKSLTADVVFDEMDVAFAAYVEMDSPVIAMLKTGDEVGVTFKGVDLPPRMVALEGSTAAIDTLISACQ